MQYTYRKSETLANQPEGGSLKRGEQRKMWKRLVSLSEIEWLNQRADREEKDCEPFDLLEQRECRRIQDEGNSIGMKGGGRE